MTMFLYVRASAQMARKPPRRPQPSTRTRHPTYAEHARRRQLVASHRKRHGNICPGWNVPAHPVTAPNYLTADHVTPRRYGGDHGPLQVLCQTCNSRRRYNEHQEHR